ncbi:ComF family protein [Lutimonas sp.]|uniref:ComF family protein n=1 Tax=Lutimonas sp. TaxID=1872403 RepID=UPI003C710AFD
MPNILANLFDLFFPQECLNCRNLLEKKDTYLCFSCLSELPQTHFSFHHGNELEMSFKGRIPVKAATSLLFFEKKGMVQKMMHELKYHNKPKIGTFLGNWLGKEMVASKRFEMIDFVVPVPLHPDRERERGYNQVHFFAKSLAKALEAELKEDLLKKIRNSQTQTLKSRQNRFLSKEKEFILNEAGEIENKHILLVDDTITSGATMQACAHLLRSVSGVRLSLASMAFSA